MSELVESFGSVRWEAQALSDGRAFFLFCGGSDSGGTWVSSFLDPT